MILVLTAHSYEDISPREARAVWEKKERKKEKKKHSLGYFRSLSCNTVSDEEADLSVSAKFTVFPISFSDFIFESAPELLSPVSVECLFWWRASSIPKCVWGKREKHHQGGQSISPLSLKGPSGHILRRLEGEYSCVYSACISCVFHWLEMAD